MGRITSAMLQHMVPLPRSLSPHALSVLVHGAASAVLYRPFKKALPKEGLRMPENALF